MNTKMPRMGLYRKLLGGITLKIAFWYEYSKMDAIWRERNKPGGGLSAEGSGGLVAAEKHGDEGGSGACALVLVIRSRGGPACLPQRWR